MRRKILLLALVISAFATGYGAVSQAYPFPWPYSRNEYRGYWEDRYDDAGKYVLAANCSGAYNYWNGQDNCNAIPNYVDTAAEFSSFIIDKYNNGSSTDRVGAAYIILTMIGENRSWPVSVGEQQEFANRVAALQPYTWWNFSGFTYNINSYNQRGSNGVGPNDIALYDDNASGHRAIIFRTSAGDIAYMIKTRCGNPVGYNSLKPLPDDLNFNITGDSTVSNASPAPGSTITFRHNIQNNGPTGTAPTPIYWIAEKTEPAPLSTVGGPAPWGTLAAGERREVYSHPVIIPGNTAPGTRFCERVGWDPVNASGGANGRGTPVCATVPFNFALTPTVTVRINDGTTPGAFAEPGDKVEFIYSVTNGGPTASQNVNCTIYGLARPGLYNVPVPHDSTSDAGFVQPPHGCPRTFPLGSTPVVTETIASVSASDLNKSLCRSFFVNPAAQAGGSASDEKCALIAAKPYARVYGGDISAGNDFLNAAGSCTPNNTAAVVGWNRGSAGGYSGTGAQYAIYALHRITDFASSLYNAGGAAAPIGLSFANTSTNVATGDFGGTLGSAPCITNYYADRPASTLAIPATVAAMTSNVYGGTGNITLGGGGIVNPNNRITVYIDGNLMINGNITYSGSWNVGSTPLFKVVVRGNIFIDNDVTQLDGVYIAQPNGASGGEIHSCATTTNGFTQLPLSTLYTTCRQKLTVNGLFVAKRVLLLRTLGTLRQSVNTEPGTSATIGETFNFGPVMWIAQPTGSTQPTGDYDAILSLPPIL